MPDSLHLRITVGIVTRNRPESLARCLASLSVLGDAVAEAIVVDDTGEVALDDALRVGPAGRTRLIRQSANDGPIVARNTIMRAASTELVLLLDDDAALLPDGQIGEAVRLLDSRPDVASIGCAMAEPSGLLWHASMQPAPVAYPCYVAAYIGFAHLLRRSAFLQVGGYRESFYFYGEEKDLCLRLLHAGYHVVYLPSVRVIHAPDPAGRNRSRYVRYAVRNDCLFALYNEPVPMVFASVPVRLARYFKMSRGLTDRGGFRWIVVDLLRQLPQVLADRRPVSWATVRHWRRLGRTWPAVA